MAADTIDYQELKENKRSEGTYYGMLTFAYKLSHAAAILIWE
jgi:Na+/melibiose symporter-like transporter